MAQKKVEATLSAYEPSLRERIYQAVAGTEQRPTAERANFARGLSELAGYAPVLGNVLAGQEAQRRGDTKGMMMAALPLPGAAKGAGAVRNAFEENMYQAYLRGKLQRPSLPSEPYYRAVPAEMGTGVRPMTPFEQNQVGLATGRYGAQGYAPEMAVTDFESYGPMSGRTSPESWGRPMSKFDENMLAAYRQGRYNRMAGGRPAPMGGDYTLEELGSAVAPYRQGGLVYEPVGGQGAARGPIEGEFSEVYGLRGPARQGYGGSMDFGVTRDGMAQSPTGMRFDPRVAAAAGGAGYMAGRGGEMGALPAFNPNIPAGMGGPSMSQMYPVMPMGATALSGQAPGAGTAFEAPVVPSGGRAQTGSQKSEGKAGKKGKEQGPPMPASPFEGNLNYYVTQALDRLLGQGEAERGRAYEQYYATNPWPY